MEIQTPRPPPRLRYDVDGCLTEECQDWQAEYIAYCCAVADRYRAAVERFRQELYAIGLNHEVDVCSAGWIDHALGAIELSGEYYPYTDTDKAEDARDMALHLMEIA